MIDVVEGRVGQLRHRGMVVVGHLVWGSSVVG